MGIKCWKFILICIIVAIIFGILFLFAPAHHEQSFAQIILLISAVFLYPFLDKNIKLK